MVHFEYASAKCSNMSSCYPLYSTSQKQVDIYPGYVFHVTSDMPFKISQKNMLLSVTHNDINSKKKKKEKKNPETKTVFIKCLQLLGIGLRVLCALSDHNEVSMYILSVSQMRKQWLI